MDKARTETVALLGSETLMGREIRDILSTNDEAVHLKLIAAEDQAAGTLTRQAGEPAFLSALDASNLSGVKAVFLAGSPESTRKVLELKTGAALIDLTYEAEDAPHARLRAPVVEPLGYDVPSAAVHIIAHPAAMALALILGRIHAEFPVRRSVVHVFEPASERGSEGLDELQQQTVNLFSFKGLPKTVYDTQLAFNMLARYGEDAPVSLENLELRIERHLATLLSISSRAPIPSLRLIQAPVFHGHSFSLWIEFEENPGVQALEEALAAEPIDLRGSDLEPPTNVGVAGQGGVAVGAIAMDRNRPLACWIWMVADNLRLAAENAVAVARQIG